MHNSARFQEPALRSVTSPAAPGSSPDLQPTRVPPRERRAFPPSPPCMGPPAEASVPACPARRGAHGQGGCCWQTSTPAGTPTPTAACSGDEQGRGALPSILKKSQTFFLPKTNFYFSAVPPIQGKSCKCALSTMQLRTPQTGTCWLPPRAGCAEFLLPTAQVIGIQLDGVC